MSGAVTAARVAAEILGREASAVSCVTPIKHGLTNESWQVQAGKDILVVRLSNRAEDALRIDRASEARILEAVAALGIGAPVLLCDPRRNVLVTRYMGPTWSLEQAVEQRNIDRLAVVLRRLHGLPAPASVRRVDLMATVEGYANTLDRHAAGGMLVARRLRERAKQVAAALREGAVQGLCHHDVHHLNIVDTNGLYLIDWEYAGIGEPMFDLASVCVYHRYDPARRRRLLTAYLTAEDAAGRAPGMRTAGAARIPALDTRSCAGSDTEFRIEPDAGSSRGANERRDAGCNGHRLELACWLFEYVRDLWAAVRELPAEPTVSLPSVSPRRPLPP